jgi:2-polyprenyl-6-methoxyphenol hydroxylase-like FAD-dependent oxidoreductase
MAANARPVLIAGGGIGNPYAVVHRGDLHGVLLKACRDHEQIELRVSSESHRLRSGWLIRDGAACVRR